MKAFRNSGRAQAAWVVISGGWLWATYAFVDFSSGCVSVCDGMGGAIGPQRDLVAQRVGRRIVRMTAKFADDDCSPSEQREGVVVARCRIRKNREKLQSGLRPFPTTLSEPDGLERVMSEQPCGSLVAKPRGRGASAPVCSGPSAGAGANFRHGNWELRG